MIGLSHDAAEHYNIVDQLPQHDTYWHNQHHQFNTVSVAANEVVQAHSALQLPPPNIINKNSYECPYCKRILYSRPSYDYHIMKHTGEKPYACKFCPYRCILKSHLDTHIKTHTGEKPYACPYCTYRCIRKYSLRKHIRIHSQMQDN